jgi:chemotaxis protein MotB
MATAAKQHVQDDEVTYHAVVRDRSSSTGRAVKLAALLFAIAAGLVYYASQLFVQHEATRAALSSARGELIELRRKSSDRGLKLVSLEQHSKQSDQELKQVSDKLLELNAELAAAQSRLGELDEERTAIRDQLAEFQQLTRQFQHMIDSGRLKVTFRRGRMIVELPAQVLFPSGSADLTADGSKALDEVAKILRGMRNRHFIVAGHTDNVPVANEHFASNWELSSARAVHVTTQLIRGGLRPDQLVAAGYSEYDPVARNVNEASRQKNRRIEIILEPRLSPVPNLDPAKSATEHAAPETKPTSAH